MNVMTLTGIRRMEVQNIQAPKLKNPDDVLLRIKKVGVCGSDVHYYKHGRIGDQQVDFPWILGHECSAVVEKTGSAVKKIKPGDLIAVDPAISCYQCDQCNQGRFHTCRHLKFLAVPNELHGCLREFITMPESSCHKVGRNLSDEVAALIEPLSIGYYAASRAQKLAGKSVGILGVGPIGLSVLQMVRLQSPAEVYCTDKLDYRLNIALEHGANWGGNPDRLDILNEIEKMNPLLLDVVFECCGQQEAIHQAIELLKPGGRLVIVGIPEGDHIQFNMNHLRRKEIDITNIRRQNVCVRPVIELIELGQLQPDFMITHRFDFEEAGKAFELVSGYRDGIVKAMITLND